MQMAQAAAACRPKVLVVEDDVELSSVLRDGLEHENYCVSIAHDGLTALETANNQSFQTVLLDVMLPKLDGFEVASAMRQAGNTTPILMLTARDSVSDKVRGFDCGIEDFVTKPFSFLELLARVRALVRRASMQPRRWKIADLVMDLDSYQVWRNGEAVALTRTEFRILQTLMRDCGRVISRPELVRAGWGPRAVIDDNNLDVTLSTLRGKIDKGRPRRLINTVRGFGYRIDTPRD
jgi:two-component system copper resistance phosphate regulon response regulator CusR